MKTTTETYWVIKNKRTGKYFRYKGEWDNSSRIPVVHDLSMKESKRVIQFYDLQKIAFPQKILVTTRKTIREVR